MRRYIDALRITEANSNRAGVQKMKTPYSKRILLVSGSPDQVALLTAELELIGFWNSVLSAADPDAGCRCLSEKRPGLVIWFYSGSSQSGKEMCRECRDAPHVPLLCIGDEQRLYEKEATSFLGRSHSFTDFFQAVTNIVKPECLIPAGNMDKPSGESDAERRYRTLFDRASDGILLVDQQTHTIVGANRRAVELYGFSHQELVGMNLLSLVPRDQHVSMWNNTRRMAEGGDILTAIERTHIRKDGSSMEVSLSTSLIQYGGRVVLQDIIRDETERNRMERELRAAKEAAETASRFKSEYLANASHEIRTPLNGILGMAQLLYTTKLSSEQTEFLEMLYASGRSLMGIVNEILDLSRVEVGKLNLQLTDFGLRDLVGDAANSQAWRANEKGLELACQICPEVPDALIGDPGRLRQILINFIGNAVKFTSDGEIIVRVTAEKQSSAAKTTLHFAISDTGIGIEESKHAQVFEPFKQAENSINRQFGGTGLGLAICKKLIEMMQGQIWLESKPGEGSTFHFIAGFDVQPVQPPYPSPKESRILEGHAVLVVDDSRSVRNILGELLAGWRLLPTIVGDGLEVLKAIATARKIGRNYSLILIDAQMPNMNGFQVAEKCFELDGIVRSQIIMLTSVNQTGDLTRCEELGLHHVTKPVRYIELLRAILSALGIDARKEMSRTDSSHEPQKATQRLHILLAEDDHVSQIFATRVLEARGHTVVSAKTGKQAVAEFESQSFDAILLDLQMPEMDGRQAAEIIRESERKRDTHTPIIALTANAMRGDRECCLEAGMDHYLSKPFETATLLELVESLAASAKMSAGTESRESDPDTVFDRKAMLESLDGNEVFLDELTGMLLEQFPQALKEIRESVQSENGTELRARAHKLKGSLASLKASAASNAARKLENAASAMVPAILSESLDELERQLELLRKYLVQEM